MPVVASRVGLLDLPLAAGAVNAPINDPTVDGLLGYIRHWLKWALDAKFATMTEPPLRDPNDPTSTADACPLANLYFADPSLLVDRFKKPALFGWWDERSKRVQFTTVKDLRVRTIHVLYVFDRIKGTDKASKELGGVDGLTRYAGLLATVDAVMLRAFSRFSHPTYQPSQTGFAAGADIRRALSLHALEYLGGQPFGLSEIDTETVREAASGAGGGRHLKDGGVNEIYPCLRCSFTVTDVIGVDTLNLLDEGGTAPDDTGDVFVTLRVAENDLDDPLTLIDGVVPGDFGNMEDPTPCVLS